MDSQRNIERGAGTYGRGRGRGRGRSTPLVCFHCSAPGHSQNNCPVRDKVKVYPLGFFWTIGLLSLKRLKI